MRWVERRVRSSRGALMNRIPSPSFAWMKLDRLLLLRALLLLGCCTSLLARWELCPLLLVLMLLLRFPARVLLLLTLTLLLLLLLFGASRPRAARPALTALGADPRLPLLCSSHSATLRRGLDAVTSTSHSHARLTVCSYSSSSSSRSRSVSITSSLVAELRFSACFQHAAGC